MIYSEFEQRINGDADRPTVIDVWAPWCGPCKAMKPHFESLSGEFGSQAQVLAINADESPEVVEQLGITGIPTVLVFRGGQEVARRMGAQSEKDLRGLFEAAVSGAQIPKVNNVARMVRIFAAALAMGLAGQFEPAWPLQAAAVGLFIWAIHDRCPIIQALKRTLSRPYQSAGKTY